MTTKKTALIIAAMLTGIALMSSCSKEPETKNAKQPEAKTASQQAQQAANKANNPKTKTKVAKKTDAKGTKQPKQGKKVAKADKMDVLSPPDKTSLTAVRNGQYASLQWHADTTGGKIEYINVLRSPTGVGKERRVAELKPDATSFKDILPDENAYWYWLKLFGKDGKYQEVGPVRVAPDRAGAAGYIKLDDKYQASITRTDYLATIKWDFPEDEYKVIDVVRYPRPVTEPFKGVGGAVPVLSTMERKSQYSHTLKNPNEEYWYWFRIIMKSGAIFYRGPIKAEYAGK